MNSLSFKGLTVNKIHQLLQEGCYAVPKLQRAFVWNGRKAALLLDSIYKQMPIGSVTIWDTSRKNKNILRHSLNVLPQYDDSHSRVWFILDGQQRLSVLFHVITGGVHQNAFHKEVDFSKVVFRVTEGDDEPRFAYRKPAPGKWISVPDIFGHNWRHRLRNLTTGQINRAETIRSLIYSYRVPFVMIESNSLEEARELFIRINSLGTPLSAADRAFARASQFDLRQFAEDTWQKLPETFRGIRNEMLLQTLALIEENGEVAERAFEEVTRRWDKWILSGKKSVKDFTKNWDRQRQAMQRAIDCLKLNFKVLDDGLLPSEYMIATLAVFFYHKKGQPGPRQLLEIRKWFWSTGIAQRYSGRGFRQNMLADAAFFKRLALSSTARFRLVERADLSDLRRTQYGQRTSIGDAFSCLLIIQKPTYLSNGQPMQVEDYASPANRKHKHHFFPKALLARNEVSGRAANSILNLCFIAAEENSSFGSKRPGIYLKQYRSKRNFSRIMESHLIPVHPKSGIWSNNIKRGYIQFIQERGKEVVKEIEKQAGMKMFRNEYT